MDIKEKPEWVKMKPQELEKLIIELHKEGNSPAKIGLILRDKHGVPKAKLIGKKITKILDEQSLQYPKEKEIFTKQIENLKIHIEKNKHDNSAKKSLTKKLWIVKKL
jgi:small subunit ribosomal protein S15